MDLILEVCIGLFSEMCISMILDTSKNRPLHTPTKISCSFGETTPKKYHFRIYFWRGVHRSDLGCVHRSILGGMHKYDLGHLQEQTYAHPNKNWL